MASTDALPVPQKNVAYRVVFPILDADGDLVTGATGLDSEVSKDQGTFADCTNEATEIATSSGVYYLDLTSTEMNADCVAVIVKTTSVGAKTTTLVLYPQEADDLKVSVTHWLGTAAATPTVAGVPEVDVTHWLGTAAATPTVAGVPEVDATHWLGTALATPDTTGYPKVTIKDGTGTGEIDTASGRVAITEAQIDQIVDETWDEARSGHTTDGTFGQVNQAVRSGTAQGGGTNTITLDASASAVDDFYNGVLVWAVGGTGAGQAGVITDYVGATKVATVDNNWRTNPDATTVFVLLPGSLGLTSATLASAVWGAARSSYTTAGTFGEGVLLASAAIQSIWDALTSALTTVGSIGKRLVDYLTGDIYARLGAPAGASMSADIAAVKSDTAAILVDTGTTLDARIPAALVGGRMDCNVGAISTDSVAADNLEAALDGTGGVTITAGVTGNITGNLSGSVGSVTGAVGSVTGAVGSVTGNVGGNVVGSVASVTGAVGSVTGNVGGNVVGSVASVTGAVGSVTGNVGGNILGTLSTTERDAIAAALLDLAAGVETGLTVRQAFRIIAAATAGKLSGGGTATEVFRNAVADAKARITATVDASGNRSAITYDLT